MMRKVGFLAAGIIIVVIMLTWCWENLPIEAQRIFHEVKRSVENKLLVVYQGIHSFVSALKTIVNTGV